MSCLFRQKLQGRSCLETDLESEVLRFLLVLRVPLELSVLNDPFLGKIKTQGEGSGPQLAAPYRIFRVKQCF